MYLHNTIIFLNRFSIAWYENKIIFADVITRRQIQELKLPNCIVEVKQLPQVEDFIFITESKSIYWARFEKNQQVFRMYEVLAKQLKDKKVERLSVKEDFLAIETLGYFEIMKFDAQTIDCLDLIKINKNEKEVKEWFVSDDGKNVIILSHDNSSCVYETDSNKRIHCSKLKIPIVSLKMIGNTIFVNNKSSGSFEAQNILYYLFLQ